MIKIQIYHNTNTDSRSWFKADPIESSTIFELVGELNYPTMPTPDDYSLKAMSPLLEMAFTVTNSIDEHWSANPNVHSFKGINVRSTSVGDVVDINGHKYMVDGCGYRELTSQEVKLFQTKSSDNNDDSLEEDPRLWPGEEHNYYNN